MAKCLLHKSSFTGLSKPLVKAFQVLMFASSYDPVDIGLLGSDLHVTQFNENNESPQIT